jgi:Pyruvate/2-oxoacid:ferredoxin oxidoreductase delta subunit
LHKPFSYRRHSKKETLYRARRAETVKSVAEPLTRHPVIDTHTYIGSSACVKACPEHAIWLVRDTARLVEPDHSIGPGVCEAACPVEAIQAVLERRSAGSIIPFVTSTVATNVPSIFPAGAEPANSSASRDTTEHGVRFTTVEQDDPPGGSIYHSLHRKLALPVT